jgi:hypothetical protein
MDKTENIRRQLVSEINGQVQFSEIEHEKIRLQEIYGEKNVWTTDEATELFDFTGFAAPFVVVRRKADGVKGCLTFQHNPRLYFDFKAV